MLLESFRIVKKFVHLSCIRVTMIILIVLILDNFHHSFVLIDEGLEVVQILETLRSICPAMMLRLDMLQIESLVQCVLVDSYKGALALD